MRSRFILGWIAAALVATGVVVWLARPEPPHPPIVVRYCGDFKGHPSFWVSNCTTRPVLVGLSAVDVPTGSTWSNCLALVPVFELEFPKRLGRGPGVLAPHEEETGEIILGLPGPPAARWRATFVALRSETRLEDAAARVETSLRHWHLLPRRSPGSVQYRVALRSGSRLEIFKTFRQGVSVEVTPEQRPVEPIGATPAGRAAPENLAKAREALRQKLRELDETKPTSPSATPPK